MAELVAAILLAIEGSVSPRKVLKMRLDFACWLIAGRVALNKRAEKAAPMRPGERSVEKTRLGGGGDDGIEKLKRFLAK